MGSGVILPSPKHRRQQQACSSAANPDRTSQPGSNALLAADGTRPEANPQQAALPCFAVAWGKRPPRSQPTRIGCFAHSPVCWFLRRPACNQPASDALPAITAGGALALNQPESRPSRAGAVERSPPHPRPVMAPAAAKRARQPTRPTARLQRPAHASPHQAVSSRDHRPPSTARTPYLQAIPNAISAKGIPRDGRDAPHRIDHSRLCALRITDFGKQNEKNAQYFTVSSRRSAKSTLSALFFVVFATKNRETEPIRPIRCSFRSNIPKNCSIRYRDLLREGYHGTILSNRFGFLTATRKATCDARTPSTRCAVGVQDLCDARLSTACERPPLPGPRRTDKGDAESNNQEKRGANRLSSPKALVRTAPLNRCRSRPMQHAARRTRMRSAEQRTLPKGAPGLFANANGRSEPVTLDFASRTSASTPILLTCQEKAKRGTEGRGQRAMSDG